MRAMEAGEGGGGSDAFVAVIDPMPAASVFKRSASTGMTSGAAAAAAATMMMGIKCPAETTAATARVRRSSIVCGAIDDGNANDDNDNDAANNSNNKNNNTNDEADANCVVADRTTVDNANGATAESTALVDASRPAGDTKCEAIIISNGQQKSHSAAGSCITGTQRNGHVHASAFNLQSSIGHPKRMYDVRTAEGGEEDGDGRLQLDGERRRGRRRNECNDLRPN